MKYLAVLIAALALTACAKKAETSTQAGRDFVVEKLFTHEGCTVYRFLDGYNYRYFTNCSGSTTWNESRGKNCNHEMGVVGR